jgi:hypothetical protein
LVGIVVEQMRFSSKVLPVVRVVTLGLIMLFVERAPFSLEVVHIKVSILLHEVNDSSLDVSLRMCERTEFSILTLRNVLWKLSAKLSLVLLNMVESFYAIM